MRHFAPSAHRCLGSMICQYQGCEASSAVSASAISVADPICGSMVSMPKKSPPSNKLYNNLSKIQKLHVAFYQDEFAFRRQPKFFRSQKIGHRPAQSTHSPTKAYTTMRPVMASVPSTHTREIWFINKQKCHCRGNTRTLLRNLSAVSQG